MVENNKKTRKKYTSTDKYRKSYNKLNISLQLNRELVLKLKEYIKDGISTKQFLENLIIDLLNKNKKN